MCGAIFLTGIPQEAFAIQAGAAKSALELPLGGPLGGHVYRKGQGVVAQHDPIMVRALYLEEEDTRLLLVSVDIHSITPELRLRVVDLLPESVSENHLILTATHTHNGPGGLSKNWLSRRYMGGFDSQMLDRVAHGIAQVMEEAIANKARATIGYRVSSKMVLSENIFAKGGVRDEELAVIRVDDSDGNPIALLGSLSAHPTTVGRNDSLTFSADFPGYFCTKLESMSHENTVAFFLNGAVGDQGCTNRNQSSAWEWTEYIGNELAINVKSVANKIDCKEYPVTLHYTKRPVPENLATSFLSSEVIFQTLEIDDLLVTFIPGEPYAALKQELTRRAKARGYAEHMMVGLSNDYVMDISGTGTPVSRGNAPGLNVLGYEAAQWCYDAVDELMQRGEPARAKESVNAVTLTPVTGGYTLDVSGSATARARQRGSAIAERITEEWKQSIILGLREKRIKVNMPLWNTVSRHIDTTPIALPLLAEEQRGGQALLSDAARLSLYAMASGAQFPSDALWLLQQQDTLLQTPFNQTNVFAVTGKRCTSDGPLMAYVAMAPPQSTVVVTREVPENGRSYIYAGLLSDLGARIGMNDAGVVMALLPHSGKASNSSTRFEIPRILAGSSALTSVVDEVKELSATDSTAMLILDRPVEDARYIDYKEYWRDKAPNDDSFLPENAPETVSRKDIEEMLRETARDWLSTYEGVPDSLPTVYAVILSPVSRSLYLAVSDGTSFPEQFQAFKLERGQP